MEKRCAVLLAAGEGKRMGGSRSKVLCQVLFRPLIGWVYQNCAGAGVSDICAVVGKDSEDVLRELPQGTHTAFQEQRLGTGHAVLCARGFLEERRDWDVLVANGDAPFLFPQVIREAWEAHRAGGNAMTVVSARVEDPAGYGRILREGDEVRAIVEERDASPAQKEIREINAGCYWFRGADLLEALEELNPQNAQGELYLTDTLEILRRKGRRVGVWDAGDPRVVLGANDRRQLAQLNGIARELVFDRLYREGVDIPVTDGVMVDPRARIGPGTQILPGTVIRGATTVGRDSVIGPNSWLEDSVLGDGCVIQASYILGSKLEDGVQIGPFSRVRPGSSIGAGCKIGNFVEVKNSALGPGTKSAHLTYIGDADVGAGVNFGCGVCIANYDGVRKHRTTVGDGCFLGCNTNLVAPVKLGDGAYTAAGTTVTEDVPEDALCIGRPRQTVLPDRAKKYRKQ
jgi:bifunctional UDP-N-acetylglucosamine pyrophosphorylase/glucosamine-1-phosphate N-acetyltransferase